MADRKLFVHDRLPYICVQFKLSGHIAAYCARQVMQTRSVVLKLLWPNTCCQQNPVCMPKTKLENNSAFMNVRILGNAKLRTQLCSNQWAD